MSEARAMAAFLAGDLAFAVAHENPDVLVEAANSLAGSLTFDSPPWD